MTGVRAIEVETPPVVPAGFPSPAEDYQGSLDLNAVLMPRPASTFVLRVSGWSMHPAGIADDDEILVDRSLAAGEGSIVVAVVEDGEFTLKRLRIDPPLLQADAPDHPDIPISDEGVRIWGVVTTVIHHVR